MKLILTLCLLLQVSYSISQTRFDNKSLTHLLNESHSGIIFTWSPFMPLSIRALNEIIEISGIHHIDLRVLIDPHPLNSFESTDVLMDSSVLIEKGMLNHFPSLTLYKSGHLLPWMIQGYEEKSSLENLIISKLRQQ